jgi:hypothetical protein
MNYEDIVESMEELHRDGVQTDKIILPDADHEELLHDANIRTRSDLTSSAQAVQFAGTDVVKGNKAMPVVKGETEVGETKGVPILSNAGCVHNDVNGHDLVESNKCISCINCDEEFNELSDAT